MTHYEPQFSGSVQVQQCGMLPAPGLQPFPGGAFGMPGPMPPSIMSPTRAKHLAIPSM